MQLLTLPDFRPATEVQPKAKRRAPKERAAGRLLQTVFRCSEPSIQEVMKDADEDLWFLNMSHMGRAGHHRQ